MLPVAHFLFYTILSAVVCFFSSSWMVSVKLLQGLQAFFLPPSDGDLNSNGIAHAGVGEGISSGGVTRNRKGKGKEKDIDEWIGDSSGSARIMRMNFPAEQVIARAFYREFDDAVLFSILGLSFLASCELSHIFLSGESPGGADHGDLIVLVLCMAALARVLRSLAKAEWDRSTTRKMDFVYSAAAGFISFVATVLILFTPDQSSIFDADLSGGLKDAGATIATHLNSRLANQTASSSPHFEPLSIPTAPLKLLLAIAAGFLGALFLPAALRLVRCYELGVRPIHWDVAILQRSSLSCLFLHASMVLPMLIPFLWVRPMAQVFLQDAAYPCCSSSSSTSRPHSTNKESAMATVPGLFGFFTCESFHNFRLAALLLCGLLQLLCLRIHTQSYLNTGIITWYQHLHGSGSRQPEGLKVRLHVVLYFLCKVALQCLAPAVTLLLLLGVSRTRRPYLDASAARVGHLVPPRLFREVSQLLACCCCSIWGAETALLLLLYRMGLIPVI